MNIQDADNMNIKMVKASNSVFLNKLKMFSKSNEQNRSIFGSINPQTDIDILNDDQFKDIKILSHEINKKNNKIVRYINIV